VNAPPDWYGRFFDGLAVDFWSAAVPPEATADDAAFLWKHLALASGARVLDVPCGDGRLTRPLASRGCVMTGVDISERALSCARMTPETADYRRADMRDLPWQDEFDAVVCFGNSFGFLEDAGNEAFLHAVARTLKPGGGFALDYGQTAESVFPRITPRQEADIGEFHFAEDTRYDPVSGRIENVFTFSRGGVSETKLASQRVYTLSELLRMLAGAGLEARAFFGSPLEEPFELGSPRLLLVAQKPAGADQRPGAPPSVSPAATG
jgi:SAM-dependent methyltransferase